MIDQNSIETVVTVIQAVTLTLAAFYYILTLQNNQRTQRQSLETRQAQLFMQIYNRWSGQDFQDAWQLWNSFEFNSLEQGIEVFRMARARRARGILSAFFEGIGVLVKEELIDIRLVAELISVPIEVFWDKISPIIDELREYENNPRELTETEYLYKALKKFIEEHPEVKE